MRAAKSYPHLSEEISRHKNGQLFFSPFTCPGDTHLTAINQEETIRGLTFCQNNLSRWMSLFFQFTGHSGDLFIRQAAEKVYLLEKSDSLV